MGDLEVDPQALRAFRGAQSIDLAPRELAILQALLTRKGKAVSRDELFDLAWGRDYMPNSRALDQYVSGLRRKVEIDPARPRIVSTVHGVGYRYDEDARGLTKILQFSRRVLTHARTGSRYKR